MTKGAGKETAARPRTAKGSVHEAIGKLIGDDAARSQGADERRPGEDATPTKPRRR